MQQLREVKYKLEDSKTSKVGFFHIFKKNISENGSEIILGIIEDEKTGNLFEIQIADFSFNKEIKINAFLKSTTKKGAKNIDLENSSNIDLCEDLPY